MCIIKKVFHYEETELPVIKCKDDIWFRGKTIAEILSTQINVKRFAITLTLKTERGLMSYMGERIVPPL